jgi:hypothetical protein
MEFHGLPHELKISQIRRVMLESIKEYSHEEVARKYSEIYEEMLARPLVDETTG